MTRYLLLVVASVLLSGCERVAPIGSFQPEKSNSKVDLLFKVEGCAVHRFRDEGRWVYFTNCDARPTMCQSESCGKSCVKTVCQ